MIFLYFLKLSNLIFKGAASCCALLMLPCRPKWSNEQIRLFCVVGPAGGPSPSHQSETSTSPNKTNFWCGPTMLRLSFWFGLVRVLLSRINIDIYFPDCYSFPHSLNHLRNIFCARSTRCQPQKKTNVPLRHTFIYGGGKKSDKEYVLPIALEIKKIR
jgi:hypothetical protein